MPSLDHYSQSNHTKGKKKKTYLPSEASSQYEGAQISINVVATVILGTSNMEWLDYGSTNNKVVLFPNRSPRSVATEVWIP